MRNTHVAIALASLMVAGTASAQPADTAGAQPGAARQGAAAVTRAEAQQRADKAFARFDANHDGKLDANDRGALRTRRFDTLDSDHDGAISRGEFAASHPAASEDRTGGAPRRAGRTPAAVAMARMGRMADTNRDGAVSRDEFVAGVLKRFDLADANRDGTLTPEERRAMRADMRARAGVRDPAAARAPGA